MGGVETYVRELCRELLAFEDGFWFTFLFNFAGHEQLASEDWAARVELVALPRLGRAGVRAISELAAVGALVDRRCADVVYLVVMTGLLVSCAVCVVMVFDIIWIIYLDVSLTHCLWRLAMPRITRRSHRVITISRAARDEVRRHLHVPDERLDIVPLGYG